MTREERIAAAKAIVTAAYEARQPVVNGKNGTHAEPVVFGDECRYPEVGFFDVDTGGPLHRRLCQLRDAAYARQRCPTAVIGVSMARTTAAMPHTVKLDAVVGTEQPPTLFVATVGPPGSGKGDAAAIATRQLPSANLELLIEGVTDHLPPGSGQGFIDVLFEMVEIDIPGSSKKRNVKQQVRNNAFFELDEGEAIGSLSKDSVLLESMRTVWSGKTVGQVNVDAERRRVLPAGTYNYGINLQVQPEKAASLINDDAGGTPQRFLWVPATDPHIPDIRPADPGPLDWRHPGPETLARYANEHLVSGEYVRFYMTQDPVITEEIRSHDLAVQRGQLVLDPLDAHALNMRRRVAAVLALWDDSMHVKVVHWELSAIVMGCSNATRAVVLGATTAAVARDAEKRRAFQASIAVAQHEALDRQHIVDAATRIAGKVHAEPERWTFASMRRDGVSGRGREIYVDAIDHAIAMNWVRLDEVDVVASHGGGGTARVLRPGPKKP